VKLFRRWFIFCDCIKFGLILSKSPIESVPACRDFHIILCFLSNVGLRQLLSLPSLFAAAPHSHLPLISTQYRMPFCQLMPPPAVCHTRAHHLQP
jgi:hypothetical protein